jgi:Rne/Rng family ribonuclease
MSKELYISSSPHETKVAVLEDDQLVEVYYERDVDAGLVGSIYKGRVSRVLPGMQSAFVNIGLERDAFLYVSDFYEDEEEYDKVFSEAEARATRYAEGGQTAVAEIAAHEVGPSIAPAPAAETVEGGATEPGRATPGETAGAPAAPASGSSVPAKPPGEPAETRRYEPRGRGRRRRGREFGERKFAPKPEARERGPERPTHGAPYTFEILPGESLAKYQDVVRSGPPEEPSAAEPVALAEPQEPVPVGEVQPAPAPEAAHETPPAEAAAVTEVHLAPADEVPPPTEESAIPSVEPAQTEEQMPLAAEAPEVSAPAEEPATARAEHGSSDALEPPALTPEAEAFLEEPAPASGAPVPEEPISQTAEPPEQPPAAAPETPTEPTEQKYTLREPYQRPRFAPRRRRSWRGTGQRAPRGDRHEPSRPGNHHPVQISDLLKEGQEILVQIAKEPLGNKGARITSHIALPGRYLVYMPTINHIGVSRKISSEDERLRLRNIILENRGALTGGFIVRTAGGGRSEEEFKADLRFLSTLWNEIKAKAERSKAPVLLHRDLDLVQRILRDMLSPDFKQVRVDSEVEYERAVEFVSRCQPSLLGHVKLYTRATPMFEEFGIQAEVDKALKPKVWLKSGGYIVINQTEALVAIDVNTGKYVGKTNRLEDTIVKTNIDAVNEIVRQIRLRDLGGIIVIDFIDMDERRNRLKVVQALEEALHRDRAPTKIVSFNDFGLVALTRKRVKQSLERTLCQPCPHCSGSGWIKSVTSVCHEIAAEVKKMAGELEGNTLTLRVNPEVAQALKSRQGALVSELESLTRKDIIIKSDPNVHQERFEIY